jgi:hypothetical protein
MKDFFPRTTATWPAVHASPFRAGTRSVIAMALVTGVLLRLYRAFVLTHGSGGSWLYVVGAFVGGAAILFGMATLHLANYPVRRWPLRVAAFALLEVAAELVTSALLISLAMEPLGTGRATMDDWPLLATDALTRRVGTLALFALVLAGVVQAVRMALGRRGARAGHDAGE